MSKYIIMKKIKEYIYINNIRYKHKRMTVFQICSEIGISIPCFCYHDKLEIAGNCRLCLVQVDIKLGLKASCITQLLPGMNIITSNRRIDSVRAGIMEVLLVNHPLDCPICDQGGECDLQDVSKLLGYSINRTCKDKRIIFDLPYFAPMIKTLMTRCIHCTRCVRYINLIEGASSIDTIERGEKMNIYANIYKYLSNELSANIIDLCPVGALTQMPKAFEARAWELKAHYSLDILDSLMSSIRIDTVNNQIMRIVPCLNEAVNEE